MKVILRMSFALLLAIFMLSSLHCIAEGISSSDSYLYTLDTDGNATITGCIATKAGRLDVPGQLDGHAVTAIGDEAFFGFESLESISLPDSLKMIGANPFRGCFSLTEITVSPNHPTLETIDGALIDKQQMKLISYLQGLTARTCQIPQEIKEIGDYAFDGCGSLASMTLPDNLTTIGDYAFHFCYGLRSIAIPDSVTEIGENPFRQCSSLTEITVSPDHPVLSTIDSALFDKQQMKLITCFIDGGVDTYQIPQGIKEIGDEAFGGFTQLRSITIPDSVTIIRANPFYDCLSLANINVSPNHPTLATIEGVLFEKPSKKLVAYPRALPGEKYQVPQGIKVIGDSAFYWCDSLESITLPDSLTTIGEEAFSGCQTLRSITIPNGVTAIGDGAFAWCEWLNSISIPDGVTAIDDRMFYQCNHLESISIPDGLTKIGDSAFYFCNNLMFIFLPDNVTEIGDSAFYFCNDLKLTLPVELKTIGDEAFSECGSIESITIPDGVTTIGDEAFFKCESLMSLSLPDSVAAIGDSAFSLCFDLIISVPPDSYAEQYVKQNDLPYKYPNVDSLDWLNE